VAYLLVTLIVLGVVYLGWRLARAYESRPTTRVIGPDDDPEFLRRLGGDTNPNPRP